MELAQLIESMEDFDLISRLTKLEILKLPNVNRNDEKESKKLIKNNCIIITNEFDNVINI